MVEHAQAELPNECCGLLAGVRDGDTLRVEAWHPLVNEAGSPIEYHAEKSLFQAVKEMREHGHDIVAIYHSHPSSAPVPSKKDMQRNFYGDAVVHFIVGLDGPEPVLRGWWLQEDEFDEAVWEIVEP
jgi:[CysO sulfur-carrier protein]-S-L-cysteine hydrolase